MSQIPIDYQSPSPPPRRPIVSWRMLWQCLRAAGFLSFIMWAVLPHVQKTYLEYGLPLPTATRDLIAIMHPIWFGLFGYGWVLVWIILLTIPFLWPQIVRPADPGQKKRRSLGWFLFSLLFMLLAAVITIAAVLPMFTLVDTFQSVNNNK